jgi:hypothetical protein
MRLPPSHAVPIAGEEEFISKKSYTRVALPVWRSSPECYPVQYLLWTQD